MKVVQYQTMHTRPEDELIEQPYFWSMLKKLLFLFMSLFLGLQSHELMEALLRIAPSELGILGELIWGAILTIFVTGMVAIPGFVFPTHRLLPDSYYSIRKPARLDTLYQTLRLDLFRWFLLKAFWGKKAHRKKFFDGKPSGIANMLYQTKQSEFGHLVPFVLLNVCSILLASKGLYAATAIVLFINTVGNFMPVVLQRWHRNRLSRMQRISEYRHRKT